jgi:diguanylate cyclase (GGDEF)-like protein
MKGFSLQARIVVFFSVLLLIVQIIGFATINAAILNNARDTTRDQLDVGERIFRRVLDQNSQKLQQAAQVLSGDFGFRDSIATGDRATIVSALINHGERIGANVMMLIALDGTLIANSTTPDVFGRPFDFPALLASAQERRTAVGFVLFDGRPHQLVIVPVLAPVPIAWVAIGFVMDDKLARELKALTSLHVSFVAKRGTGPPELFATTLPANLAAPLLDSVTAKQAGGQHLVATPDGDYQTLTLPLARSTDWDLAATLQRSLRESMRPFHQLQLGLIVLTLAGVVLSVIGSIVTARGITQPIRMLAGYARGVAQGDYSKRAEIDDRSEIGDLAQAFNRMIDGIAAREFRITELAYRDTLTGLPNRALFLDRLRHALSQAQRTKQSLSVLHINLDRFKFVNVTLGHHIGDLLIREVGLSLQKALPRQSDTVARLGADEFVVLLPLDDCAGAQIVTRRLLKALERTVELENQSVDVNGSVGIASFPQHGEDAESLMRHADMAMYTAKRSNSGFAVFDPRFHQHQPERLSLMSELRRAVERDEFVLFYQPKVELATGSVKYAEALLRWQHPQRGFVPPDHFIPFAEKTGYVKAVTRWVIDHTLAQCADWQRRGIIVNVSINISARDLLNPELTDIFAAAMRMHGVPAQRLWLEITESAIMEDPKYALDTLERLHAMGLTLSIDDFGTGYSSLAYLKKLPVDELKIDKSFVMGMAADKDDSTIVRSTIDLAHNMGLKVVAEGVENQEILDMLRALGCDLAQGYFISRPLPPDRFEQWLRESTWGAHAPPPLIQVVSG